MMRINQTEKLCLHGKNLTLFSFYFTCFFSEKKEKESVLWLYTILHSGLGFQIAKIVCNLFVSSIQYLFL